jgi:hypothetical protein
MSEDKVFLYNPKIIQWETPLPEGEVWMSIGKPSILITEWEDLSILNNHSFPYRVLASATAYLADISHMTSDEINEVERGVLYSGAIAIYKAGQIPGTKINGPHFEMNGRIWESRKPNCARGLSNLIFGNAITPDQKITRIEAILAGYEAQRKEEHL